MSRAMVIERKRRPLDAARLSAARVTADAVVRCAAGDDPAEAVAERLARAAVAQLARTAGAQAAAVFCASSFGLYARRAEEGR